MIERATRSIEIEYYSYNADMSGRLLAQLLVKKAQKSVKVRMLLDSFVSRDQITPFTIYELKKAGVEVKYYNNSPLRNLDKAFYRNHQMILNDVFRVADKCLCSTSKINSRPA